jgi:hypothetical protein
VKPSLRGRINIIAVLVVLVGSYLYLIERSFELNLNSVSLYTLDIQTYISTLVLTILHSSTADNLYGIDFRLDDRLLHPLHSGLDPLPECYHPTTVDKLL